MSEASASCPSKIIATGEYAVLDGAEAVVLAVDRRAQAVVREHPTRLSPFLSAVASCIAEELGADHPAAHAAKRVEVDTSSLYAGRDKLGLGSSAAACVAAVGAALTAGGEHLDTERAHSLAHAAHYRAQTAAGVGGSGVDIAACAVGGVIAARTQKQRPSTYRRLPGLGSLHMRAIWTGASADTRELVAAVRAFAARSPRAYDARRADLETASAAFAAALEKESANAALEAFARAGEAIGALGRDAALDLVTGAHDEIGRLAGECGGRSKATGAGGGDLALALFPDANAAERFTIAARSRGMIVPTLSVDSCGLHSESRPC